MKRGFTLIELLTVIAIIGILSSIIVVSSGRARQEARDAKRKSDLNAVSTALEMYYANQRKYPNSSNVWIWSTHLSDAILPNFISLWPTDPSGTDGFGIGFAYCSDGTKYALDVILEGEETITHASLDDSSGCTTESYFTGYYTLTNTQKYHYRVTNK